MPPEAKGLPPEAAGLPPEATGTLDPAADGAIVARPPQTLFALKHANSFVVADALGDISGHGDGLFRNDTRVLSHFRLLLAGGPPSLLGARIARDDVVFTTNLTNRPLPPVGGTSTPEGVLHIERSRFLWNSVLYERLHFTNYDDEPISVMLGLQFAADFADMFEVRGSRRARRGTILPALVEDHCVLLRYEGLDGTDRACRVSFSEPPQTLEMDHADIPLSVAARASHELYIEIGAETAPPPSRARYRKAAAHARWSARVAGRRGATIRTSGRFFDAWIDKSRADISLLTTELPTGPYPYAGIPWFSTPFGRDAIITALQTLWLDPALARGVLSFLARHQATETSSFQDSAPGKILHEVRRGEMAVMRELPFAEYYGSVDTTPLFVMLAGAYAERTGDLDYIDGIWSSLCAAAAWIEGASRADPGGFLSYARGAATGLANQGWKDSHDSIFHADGRLAEGPIALIEVQGYVFSAFQALANLAERRGEDGASFRASAEALRAQVEQRFWIEELGTYALAIDGAGQPCRVRSSNAGQLLYTGLPTAERAASVARQLLSPGFHSGWGIRTIAQGESRYNPMSYHNGSVWPHDTALCTAGLARYGFTEGVAQIATDMFDAAVKFDMRLPELFCGFSRTMGEAPIAYPVACLPQAWAAGAAFMVLQASLGVEIDGWQGEIHVRRPHLPMGVTRLTVRRLEVGAETVDLTFQRIDGRTDAFLEGGRKHVPIHVHR